MQGPETRLRKRIVKVLLREYPQAYVRKVHGNAYQNIGIADLLCCFEGHFIALEVKRPKKLATPAQLLEGRKVEKAGGTFAIVTSPEEAILAVKRGLKNNDSCPHPF